MRARLTLHLDPLFRCPPSFSRRRDRMAVRYRRKLAFVLAAGLLAVLGASPRQVDAQNTSTIRGTVREAGSGRPVSTIQVFAPESGRGTLTNSSGTYQLVGLAAGNVQIT